MAILNRIALWPSMRKDVASWVETCLTCQRFRKRLTKQETLGVRRPDIDCWEEVMIDMEGPSTPAERDGNKHVLTYICRLRHGVLLEPCWGLKHSELRQAFARCLF
eukprot:3604813-Alexandrium_andersonii.AAC.1